MNAFTIAVEEDLIIDESADAVMKGMGLSGPRMKYAGCPRRWIGDNPVAHASMERPESVGRRSKPSICEVISRTAWWTISQTTKGQEMLATFPTLGCA